MDKGIPETHQQAAEWDRINSSYLRVGLCYRCASQAAWGHQLGFNQVHSPCLTCQTVIDGFPVEKANGWRVYPRGRASAFLDS